MIALDIETTGLERYKDKITFVSALGQGYEHFKVQPDETLRKMLADPTLPKIIHNASFDVTRLIDEGYKVEGLIYDTMIQEQIALKGYNENRGYNRKHLLYEGFSLKASLKRRLNIDLSKELATSFKGGEVTFEQLTYAKRDVLYLHDLHKVQKKASGFINPFDIEAGARLPIILMERNGVPLEKDLWNSLVDIEASHFEQVKKDLGQWEYNKQAEVLQRYGCNISEVKDPLYRKYRGLHKLQTTYGKDYLEKFVSPNGRAYPRFFMTASGRIILSKPNLHQLPKAKDKTVTTVSRWDSFKGLTKADFKAQEVMIAKYYSDETNLNESYHDYTANQLGVTRSLAKTINFAIMYGAGAKGLSKSLLCSLDEAKAILKTWGKAYGNFTSWKRYQRSLMESNGFSTTITGRKREFIGTNTLSCTNHIIQGTASDILKRTLARLYKRGIVPVLCVHDSVFAENVPFEDLVYEMEQGAKDLGFKIRATL